MNYLLGNFTVDTVYQVSPFVDEFLYIAGVPYEAASQLLSKINNDPNSVAKRALLESLTCEKVDRLVRHKSPLTPGYVTKDDLGTDGKLFVIRRRQIMCSLYISQATTPNTILSLTTKQQRTLLRNYPKTPVRRSIL